LLGLNPEEKVGRMIAEEHVLNVAEIKRGAVAPPSDVRANAWRKMPDNSILFLHNLLDFDPSKPEVPMYEGKYRDDMWYVGLHPHFIKYMLENHLLFAWKHLCDMFEVYAYQHGITVHKQNFDQFLKIEQNALLIENVENDVRNIEELIKANSMDWNGFVIKKITSKLAYNKYLD